MTHKREDNTYITVAEAKEYYENTLTLLRKGDDKVFEEALVRKYSKGVLEAIMEGTIDMSKFKEGGFTKGGKV